MKFDLVLPPGQPFLLFTVMASELESKEKASDSALVSNYFYASKLVFVFPTAFCALILL